MRANARVMSGPCKNRNTEGATPGECARAMTKGYAAYYEAVVTRKPSQGSLEANIKTTRPDDETDRVISPSACTFSVKVMLCTLCVQPTDEVLPLRRRWKPR